MHVRKLRRVFRLLRAVAVAYTLWRGLMRGRWLAAGFALWRILRRDPAASVSRAAAVEFLSADEPAIYRRKGWRKLDVRARVRP